jgi:hypothetical protein
MTDFLKAAGGILATLAPTVATVLGGPLAGMATTALVGALGLEPTATSDEIMKAVAGATPEQLIKLKEVEAQLILDLKKLDVDVMRIDASDRDSARKREMTTLDYTPRIIAGLIISLYIGVQYFIFAGHSVDDSMMQIALRSLGTLDAAVTMVLAYYFGSSAGSRNKDNQIATLVNGNGKNGH